MSQSDLMLILPDWLISTPLEPPYRGYGVCVEQGKVKEIATHEVLLERYPSAEIVQAKGQVCAPGFVDAHTHLYGVLAHGIPLENAPSGFWSFLVDFWWPKVEDQLTREMICAATAVQMYRMARSGITCFYDCTEAPFALPGVLRAQAEVVAQSGMRGVLSFEATERVSPENGQLGLRENVACIEACASSERLRGLMCFHTTFTCSEAFIRQAFDLAERYGVLTHCHLSEGTFEPEYCLEHFGMRPVFYYEKLGVLGDRMLASQCVQLDTAEIERLAKAGVKVTHMPLSNCEVGGGIAPIPDLVAAGVQVGLGSDGYITDFFEVMRGAFLIHKAAKQNPQVMPAWQVWYLATEGGARALNLEGVGRLAPGWYADLQLFQVNLPTPLEEHNLYEQTLLYVNSSQVRSVMVGGEWLMRDGFYLKGDAESLTQRAHQAALELWQKVHHSS
ncbi:MAG: amidohydrolase family protein [Anaerolineales bacterium]|nr:amidohydrolase family protein [Anaerolineales bacterium]MDW8161978.1 amidohydrolase family protein [Anaerolineales bacterium]